MKKLDKHLITMLMLAGSYGATAQDLLFDYSIYGNRETIKCVPHEVSNKSEDLNKLVDRFNENVELTLRQIDAMRQICIEIKGKVPANSFVRVYNLKGILVSDSELQGAITLVDFQNEPKGVYIVNIMIGEEEKQYKIIKK